MSRLMNLTEIFRKQPFIVELQAIYLLSSLILRCLAQLINLKMNKNTHNFIKFINRAKTHP